MEKLAVILLSGFVGYIFARTKFVSERWWDKKYDTYISAFDALNEIEHALAILEWASETEQFIEKSLITQQAIDTFDDNLHKIHCLQNRMMMLDMKEEHIKLIVLSSALSIVSPILFSENCEEPREEIVDLIKQSKGMAGGCGGELALLGRSILKNKSNFLSKIIKFVKTS